MIAGDDLDTPLGQARWIVDNYCDPMARRIAERLRAIADNGGPLTKDMLNTQLMKYEQKLAAWARR